MLFFLLRPGQGAWLRRFDFVGQSKQKDTRYKIAVQGVAVDVVLYNLPRQTARLPHDCTNISFALINFTL